MRCAELRGFASKSCPTVERIGRKSSIAGGTTSTNLKEIRNRIYREGENDGVEAEREHALQER